MTAEGFLHAKECRLWGGPKHGQTVAVPAGMNIIRVIGGYPTKFHDPALARHGQYSQVSGPGNQHNFEWDGWDPR